MSNELIVQRTRVLLDLNKIEGHSGDFRNDDSSQCICYCEVSVEQLKLDHIARELKNLDLRLSWKTLSSEALARLGLSQLLLVSERLSLDAVARGRIDLHH